jgi:hypothetical protein
VLKVRLADLRRELHVLRTGVANVDVLKREVASLGRQLLQERTKVKALSEELESPLNVHRWGAAPAKAALSGAPVRQCRVSSPHRPTHNTLSHPRPRQLLALAATRWRKLEGSDPSTYEMIQKIQTLQKRLIGKTEEVVEKDLLIQVRVRVVVVAHAAGALSGAIEDSAHARMLLSTWCAHTSCPSP